ncbi:MAG: hypothetical protein WCJ46_03455 [bacterium]
MSMVEKEVIEKIGEYVAKKGGQHREWYLGLAEDPKKAMFQKHNVDKDTDYWFFKFATDAIEAARIQDKMLMSGFDGEKVSHDAKAIGVFVYRKRPHTKE